MNIEEIEQNLKILYENLENDLDYNMSDEMQELYYLIKEQIEDFESFYLRDQNSQIKLTKVKKSFNQICKEYETPDNVIDDIMSDMFPNGEDDDY